MQNFIEEIKRRIEDKKSEIKKQEDYIFQQECGNDFYCLSGNCERDYLRIANLKRELRELEQEIQRNEY